MQNALLMHVVEGHQDLLYYLGCVFFGESPVVFYDFIVDLH